MKFLKRALFFAFVASVIEPSVASEHTEEVAIKPYCLNLMWVNKELNEKNTYIFPQENANGFFRVAKGWAKNNQASKNVCIWYDSQFVTEDQIKNTDNRLTNKSNSEYVEDSEFVKKYDSQVVKENQNKDT